MTKTPELTIVVPTWNRVERLRDLLPDLEALAADGDVEVVIVDDGSTDGTRRVLEATTWATVIHQPNGGAAAARNTGWKQATAPVVVFLDDDCRPGAGWPTGLLHAFTDKDVVGVGGRIESARLGTLESFVTVERLVDHGRDLVDGVDYLITANAAFLIDTLADVGGFDEAFPGAAGEDVDLSWRIRAGGGRLARSAATVYHDHRASIREVLGTYRGHGRARALLDERFPDRSASTAAKRAVAPAVWTERYTMYRQAGVAPLTAVALLGLRAAGLVWYLMGLRDGHRLQRARIASAQRGQNQR